VLRLISADAFEVAGACLVRRIGVAAPLPCDPWKDLHSLKVPGYRA
jgi:hypothetical protein